MGEKSGSALGGGGGGGSIFSSLTVVLFSLPSLSFYVRHFYLPVSICIYPSLSSSFRFATFAYLSHEFFQLFYATAAAVARKSLAVVTAPPTPTPTHSLPLFPAPIYSSLSLCPISFSFLGVWQTFRCHALSFVSPLVCRPL